MNEIIEIFVSTCGEEYFIKSLNYLFIIGLAVFIKVFCETH